MTVTGTACFTDCRERGQVRRFRGLCREAFRQGEGRQQDYDSGEGSKNLFHYPVLLYE
jgi:hypothetical protein